MFRRPEAKRRVAPAAPTTVAQVATPVTSRQASPYEIGRRKATRSRELIDVITTIDTTMDPAVQRELMDWIRESYNERGGGIPIGLLAKCYLGHPYVDHRMSLVGDIIEHFTGDQSVPAPFGSARPLVKSDAYLFVEVYDDGAVVPVRADGTAII